MHYPPEAPQAPPPVQEPTSAPFLTGKGALSYGLEGQREYGPPGPYQSTISLNLDSIRGERDYLFADLHGLKANVIMFQDHRKNATGSRAFAIDAAEKIFRVKPGRFCAVVADPLPAPNGQLYGGAMVMIHPHYSGRVVAKIYDTRGLGRYAAITLRGKNGSLITFISVYLTPSPGGDCGQAAAQQRYIDRHQGGLPTSDPYTLAVMDIADLVAERHRAGSSVVVGGRPTNRRDGRLQPLPANPEPLGTGGPLPANARGGLVPLVKERPKNTSPYILQGGRGNTNR